ncbi:MAG: TetR family transcriptional regulator [Thermoleophilia bacterium]|nr:TetR family transcriptional regulator [Thermoleophilia bacterium]
MRPLTISQLERESGVSRGVIYYYISEGLLPPAQKASATRAVYDQRHVDLLREISQLKKQGLRLREIRERIAPQVQAASETDVDLVSQQADQIRSAILHAAAIEFATHGYEKTRVADICKKVGVTGQMLYSFFPSKRHLFIACYEVYYQWMHEQIVPHIAASSDSAARLAWRSWASYGIRSLNPDLQAMARVEAVQSESDLRQLVRRVYESILNDPQAELAEERKPGPTADLFDEELVSYALVGALENMQMRASWDGKFTKKDVMRNLLAMFLAIRAALAGKVDLTDEWKKLEPLVEELAKTSPHPGPKDSRCSS